ncbi:MAG: glycosyltransferase [Bacteroidales bacterium]|nr:glycosyltransferase [Bacteroidales bacterium]
MNILIVNQILYTHTDGIIPEVDSIKDTLMYQMCLGFKENGHDVTLAAASEFRPVRDEQYDFEVLWFPSDFKRLFPAAFLPYSRQLKRFLKQNCDRYDLIISKEVFMWASAMLSSICPEKTLLWTEQAYHQKKFHQIPSKIWFNVVARLFMKRVRAVVPCSACARDFLKKYLPATSDTIVEHGIDIDKFTPSADKKRQFLVTARLVERKNVDKIISIFAALHREPGYEDLELLIAGRGPEEQRLRELAASEGAGDCVSFLGFIPQTVLREYMSRSLASLVNPEPELNMVSVPESICCATPLVMNEVPLSSWYVKEYSLGIVKKGWDVEELKEIIRHNSDYVENCMEYRTELSTAKSAQKLVDIYQTSRYIC